MSIGFYFLKIDLAETFSIQDSDYNLKEEIVVLGESTSVISRPANTNWPQLLQKKLNQHGGSFKVKNLAEAGVDSSFLLRKLDQYLIHTKPNIVITMTGINDLPGLIYKKFGLLDRHSIWMSFKLYRLYLAVKVLAIEKFFRPSRKFIQKIEVKEFKEPHRDIIDVLKFKSVFSEELLLNDISKLSDLERASYTLRLMQLVNQIVSHQQSELLIKIYNAIKFNEPIVHKIKGLSGGYLYLANIAKDKEACLAIAENSLKDQYAQDWETINQIGKCLGIESTIFKKLLIKFSPDIEIQKDVGDSLRKNYRALYELSKKHNFCWVLVGYPLESLAIKEKFFSQDELKIKKIFFVENKINFEIELLVKSYDDLFIDRFAVSFGHTNEAGSNLIAEAVYGKIAKILASDECLWGRQ